MAQRLAASKKAAAARGELRTPLPVGYVHDQAGEVVIDPDAEVVAAVGDLFAAFATCGSAYGVVAAFTDRRFPLRAYGGAWAGALRWGRLTHARVLGVLICLRQYRDCGLVAQERRGPGTGPGSAPDKQVRSGGAPAL